MRSQISDCKLTPCGKHVEAYSMSTNENRKANELREDYRRLGTSGFRAKT